MKKMITFSAFLFVSISSHLISQTIDPGLMQTMRKTSIAWESPAAEGLSIWNEILSDESFIMIFNDPNNGTSVGKKDFLSIFENMQKNDPIMKQERKTLKVRLYGSIAYELAALENTSKSGKETTMNVVNIFRMGQGKWSLVFSTTPEGFESLLE